MSVAFGRKMSFVKSIPRPVKVLPRVSGEGVGRDKVEEVDLVLHRLEAAAGVDLMNQFRP
jgi:hypothetical protein